MVFEHVLQIFSGKCCLLPLKEVFMVKRKVDPTKIETETEKKHQEAGTPCPLRQELNA